MEASEECLTLWPIEACPRRQLPICKSSEDTDSEKTEGEALKQILRSVMVLTRLR
jgi:hypothetical protein